ncbi:hypothetical protein [Methylobacterium brachythecii]|uniref:Uncharacterized protein n=1 Tax=Methylobacterium brachythecii TaxID=1176177 RepID=A0A7W6F966_9HYPH|nr:hypothetical protein [Methylobacterium brachythecii]MBB3905227.1 hypothetical protein [Methylobacterium brachythecii]GLS47030.1 hypothetical protein GCM10007884_50300 [Methylobacterium brachythecii]
MTALLAVAVIATVAFVAFLAGRVSPKSGTAATDDGIIARLWLNA